MGRGNGNKKIYSLTKRKFKKGKEQKAHKENSREQKNKIKDVTSRKFQKKSRKREEEEKQRHTDTDRKGERGGGK